MTVSFKGRLAIGIAALMLAGAAGLAQAAHITPDLKAKRGAQPVLRNGDFNGDGHTDSLSLINEANTGRIAVHISLAGGDDLRVTSFDASAAPALRVVPAGTYAVDCGNFSSGCAEAPITLASDGLILAMDGGVSVLLHWQDGQFAQDFVRSDESDMARVASALYAVNR